MRFGRLVVSRMRQREGIGKALLVEAIYRIATVADLAEASAVCRYRRQCGRGILSEVRFQTDANRATNAIDADGDHP
ncbi:MAG: hypothetical protein JWL59_182 [Chthoniobacteraceae bacterium]|nr:hypothetical protein [Chthoniobacteraceae bacterium]